MRTTRFVMKLAGAAVVSLLLAPMAVAGSVTVKNCLSKPIWAKAYNSNDGLMLIASSESCIQPSQSFTLQCATSSCKVATRTDQCSTWQNTLQGTYSGPHVFSNLTSSGQPKVRPTLDPGTNCP
jgi:hypothetical protein